MKSATNKKILYIGLVLLFIFLAFGIFLISNKKTEEKNYDFPKPEKVVEQYFIAWNDKDYANMYAVFSDGFKKIEPTAKTLQDFKNYVDSQEITNVEIKNIKEISNDGETASVDYEVVFKLANRQKLPYSGTFTLKYRQSDIIQGWKLIHPYGENIDVSK